MNAHPQGDQFSLFDSEQLLSVLRYPSNPGHKERDSNGASAAAVRKIAGTVTRLRLDVLRQFQSKPDGLTADECAALMARDILSIRPRVSELAAIGKIIKTALRRQNESRCTATVWKLAPPAAQPPETQPGNPSPVKSGDTQNGKAYSG